MNNLTAKSSFSVVFWAIARHAFVIATGFAALVHSTWTLATIFNGPEPKTVDGHWFAWVLAAFLFAFAIDVGQIAISVELRGGERTRAKFIAFAVLAALTYFFQWWYVAMHLPDMPLSAGVRTDWLPFATTLRDAALWVVPGALPLATTIYTFSYAKPKIARSAKSANAPAIAPATTLKEKAIVPFPKLDADFTIERPPEFPARCNLCGWEELYATKRSATNALVAHNRHHHSEALSSNGRH